MNERNRPISKYTGFKEHPAHILWACHSINLIYLTYTADKSLLLEVFILRLKGFLVLEQRECSIVWEIEDVHYPLALESSQIKR